MHKIKLGLLALAAGLLVQGAAVGSAQANPAGKAAAGVAQTMDKSGVVQVRHGGRHFRHGGFRRHWGGHRRWGGHRNHFRHRYWGPRVHIYSGGYRGGCYGLKRRAIVTGSRYWWRRYNACRYGW